MKYASMYERLIANSEKPDDQNENGCWVWTGKTDSKRWPYGMVTKRGKDGKVVNVRAHRAMFNELDGDWFLLDTVDEIDHLCENPLCINPDHWRIVTKVENAKRSQEVNPRWMHLHGHG